MICFKHFKRLFFLLKHILFWNVLRCPSGPGSFYFTEVLMSEKPFKTHEQLIELLSSRGMDFSAPDSKSFAKKKLQRIGYYNLINGYSSLFWKPDCKDSYQPGTTLREIYNLYLFDQKLREIFLHNILPLETNIKSLIAYHFPKMHPETHYLTYENFDTTKKDASRNITGLLSDIQRQVAGRCSDPSISHYLNNYGYIPLWVLNNILTLGSISKFYSMMQQKERQEIAKTFHLSDKELENILTYISSIRNFCAHGNRLYCYRSKRPLSDTALHATMQLPKSEKNEYLYGKRDLFAVMIALKLTSSKRDFRRLIKDVDIALKNLYSRSTVLTQEVILTSMGFPSNWKDLLLQN